MQNKNATQRKDEDAKDLINDAHEQAEKDIESSLN